MLSNPIENHPILPKILSLPCKAIPSSIHSQALVMFLNRLLKDQILEGDLNFLEDKCLCISIYDASIKFYIGLHSQRLISASSQKKVDIEIQASMYNFLQLAARQQDPDTLVFQRHLFIQGNTELGLELKNFLDGVDLDSLLVFKKIESLLIISIPLYKRLFTRWR